MPVLLGLIGIWYTNLLGCESKAVLPYAHELRRFAAYLQQLDMESQRQAGPPGRVAGGRRTGPIVWGEPGTNGQHAFYQLLHQGTRLVPVDLIGFAVPEPRPFQHQHDLLSPTCSRRPRRSRSARRSTRCGPKACPTTSSPHRAFPGNRPSTTILAERLTPSVLGQLIALYEHIVFVQGACGTSTASINGGSSWAKPWRPDQPELTGPAPEPGRHDSSTSALVGWYRAHRAGGDGG